MFHLPLLFELLSSSDPGHKKFWKRGTGSMFSLQKTLERCVSHMSALSLRKTLGFRSDYDFLTLFKLLHYCSINLDCCLKTYEYFIPTIKKNCQTDNYGQFGKKLLLWNYVPFSSISCHSNQSNYARGWGFCFIFSTREPEFWTEKLSLGRGF